MHRLFLENYVWEELQRGNYTFDREDKVHWPVKQGSPPAGGTQIIHKWKDLFGRHTVTTHMIVDADGWPVHWDEKDLILGETKGETKYVHHPAMDT